MAIKQEIFYDDEENIIDSDEEIIRWIVEDLNKYNLKGIYLQKNDFTFTFILMMVVYLSIELRKNKI